MASYEGMNKTKVRAVAVILLLSLSVVLSANRQACVQENTSYRPFAYMDIFDISRSACCHACFDDDRCVAFVEREASSCRARCSLMSSYNPDIIQPDQRHAVGVPLRSPNDSCGDRVQFDCGKRPDVNECSLCSNLCPHGSCRNNVFGSFFCVCEPGYHPVLLPFPTCEDIDECAEGYSHTCINGICINTDGSFTCVCQPGFQKDDQGNCVDINECERSDICIRGQCLNLYGSHKCKCPAKRIKGRREECPTKQNCMFNIGFTDDTTNLEFGGTIPTCQGTTCTVEDGQQFTVGGGNCPDGTQTVQLTFEGQYCISSHLSGAVGVGVSVDTVPFECQDGNLVGKFPVLADGIRQLIGVSMVGFMTCGACVDSWE